MIDGWRLTIDAPMFKSIERAIVALGNTLRLLLSCAANCRLTTVHSSLLQAERQHSSFDVIRQRYTHRWRNQLWRHQLLGFHQQMSLITDEMGAGLIITGVNCLRLLTPLMGDSAYTTHLLLNAQSLGALHVGILAFPP